MTDFREHAKTLAGFAYALRELSPSAAGELDRIAAELNAAPQAVAAPADDLRAKVRAITASLRDREWADDLSERDPDVLDLGAEITELVGRVNLAPSVAPISSTEARLALALQKLINIESERHPGLVTWVSMRNAAYEEARAAVLEAQERARG